MKCAPKQKDRHITEGVARLSCSQRLSLHLIRVADSSIPKFPDNTQRQLNVDIRIYVQKVRQPLRITRRNTTFGGVSSANKWSAPPTLRTTGVRMRGHCISY